MPLVVVPLVPLLPWLSSVSGALAAPLVEAPLEDTDTGNALADFTIVTPRATVIDHCAELAKRFGKTKSEDAKPAN